MLKQLEVNGIWVVVAVAIAVCVAIGIPCAVSYYAGYHDGRLHATEECTYANH